MKTTTRLLSLALILILACASLPGCKSTDTAQVIAGANTVTASVSLLPAALVSKVQSLVAKYPKVAPYLVTVANGLESIANVESKLPSPDSTEATLLEWTAGNIPGIGQYVTDLVNLYKLYYPTIAPTGAALSELAEVVRASTPATAVAFIPIIDPPGTGNVLSINAWEVTADGRRLLGRDAGRRFRA